MGGIAAVTLGERLKMLREERGLTQAEVAKLVGCETAAAVANWEHGRREPSVMQLARLARAWGVTVDYLIAGVSSSDALVAELDRLRKERDELEERIRTHPLSRRDLRQYEEVTARIWRLEQALPTRPVPILRAAPVAGPPVWEEDDIMGYYQVPVVVDVDYALYIRGDALTGEGYREGDLALVKAVDEAGVEPGDLVVARTENGGWLIRFLAVAGGSRVLRAANPACADVPLASNMFIAGVVRRVDREVRRRPGVGG